MENIKTMKNKQNISSIGAGLSFALLAFLSPSLAFSDTTVSYSTYTVTDEDGVIALSKTDSTYTVSEEDGVTSSEGTLNESDYEGVYYNDSTTADTAPVAALTVNTEGYTVSADFVSNFRSATGNGGVNGGALIVSKAVSSISGDFINNTAHQGASTETKNASGGAIFISASNVESISSNFYGNTAYVVNSSSKAKVAQGGAIYNYDGGTISSISGDFADNAAYSNTGKNGTAQGGAISNNGTISSIEGNFYNNYVWAATVYGGAIYGHAASSTTFKATTDNYYYLGNYAAVGSDATKSDANGGFLYLQGTASATFDTSTGYSITIGYANGEAGYDSIASSNANSIITKTGAGTLTVNSSMQYYTGSLKVEAGTMTINNSLGSTVISITQGASLSVDSLEDNIALSVYLSGGSSSDEMFSTLDSVILDTLSIYLTADLADGDTVLIYDNSGISATTVNVYDADNNLLDSSLYSFSSGTFTYGTAAVPEPSTYAMIFGVIALGFAYYRRRK